MGLKKSIFTDSKSSNTIILFYQLEAGVYDENAPGALTPLPILQRQQGRKADGIDHRLGIGTSLTGLAEGSSMIYGCANDR